MSQQALDDFPRLFTEYGKRVYHFIHSMVQDRAEAEDLTQETFIKVYRNLPGLQDPSSLSTWIYRVAANVCRDHFRQSSCRHRPRTSSLEKIAQDIEETPLTQEEGEPHPTAEEAIDQTAMGECVQGLLKGLPADYRLVVVLHDLEGWKNPEIAEILGCSVDTVKIRLHRARSRLRERLLAGCEFSRNERNVFVCHRLPG